MTIKKYQSNIWNKQRVIDACLELCNEEGHLPEIKSNDSLSWSIREERLRAALKSQNIDYEALTNDFNCKYLTIDFPNEEEYEKCFDLEDIFSGIIYLVSYNISEKDLSQLKVMLEKYYESFGHYEDDDLNIYYNRCVIFDQLFKYRKAIYEMEHFDDGVFCSVMTSCFASKITNSIYKNNIKPAADYLDEILCLLMGENFAQSITVKKLINQFGYPNFSEKELQDIDIENF